APAPSASKPKAAPKPKPSSRPGNVQIKERIDAKPVPMAGSSGEAKFASEDVVSINELLQNRSQLNAGTIEGHQPSYKVDLAFQVVPKEEAQADERENGDENDDNAADGGGHDDDEPEEVESDEDSPFDRHGNLRGGTSLSALSAQHLE